MKLYHGSYTEIKQIDLSKSKPNKDFGQGFYLTEDFSQALEMAKFKAAFMAAEPIVNVYSFDENILNDGRLKVKTFDGYTEEWAKFVYDNRTYNGNGSSHDYDIVYGPIADDRVGVQIRRLMEGDIPIDVFLEKLKYMKGITFQYFFGTQLALNQLHKEEQL